MGMIVMMVVVVVVMVIMGVVICMMMPPGRYASISFELLHTTSMDCTRVCPGCLNTCMRQQLNDCFEVLLGSLW